MPMQLKVIAPPQGVAESTLLFKTVCVNPIEGGKFKHMLVKSDVFDVAVDAKVPVGSIVLNKIIRNSFSLAFGDVVACEPFVATTVSTAKTITVVADYLVKSKNTPFIIVAASVKESVRQYITPAVLTVGQKFALPSNGLDSGSYLIEISDIDGSTVPLTRGNITQECVVLVVKNPTSNIPVVGEDKTSKTKNKIIKDVNLMGRGIGGMDVQFAEIFRAAFASRMYSPAFLEKVGRKHVKGLILYGPPGTGKTLLARQIGEMLNVASVTAIAGPELLSPYVGKAEENIRNLFTKALEDTKRLGEDSPLHLIIFDEIDAICRKRGSGSGTSSQVNDSMVNQLLSMIDGVKQLNNIFIVGMTNRMDLLDDALLRPGRFELKIQVSLPDERGRQEILQIHTLSMRTTGIMDSSIDLAYIASQTKNFSGAELEGLVRDASSFGLLRGITTSSEGDVTADEANVMVTPEDFELALRKIKPLFGTEEAILKTFVPYGVIRYGPNSDRIVDKFMSVFNVITSGTRNSAAVMIDGPIGSGKTALASYLATETNFPFVKVISPDILAGFGAAEKHAEISRIFHNAHRSPKSIIILDDIEGMIDYIEFGGIQFSNQVLQCIISFIRKPPPPEAKLLVIATCTNWPVLSKLGLGKAIQERITLQNLTKTEILEVLIQSSILKKEDVEDFVNFSGDLFTTNEISLKSAFFEAEKFVSA